MIVNSSPKAKALKHVNLAKAQLERAMKDFENGADATEIILKLNKSIEHLRMADKSLLEKHLNECLPKMKPEQLTEELVKTFKYSQR